MWSDLKRLTRYLARALRAGWRFEEHRHMSKKTKAAVDCDFAGDIANRKSATGLIFNGRKTRGQHGFGLEVDSVAELRRERLPRHGESWRRHLRLRALLSDGRVVAQLVIASCSSAARSLSSRRGLGRERHVRTRVFWRQVRVKLRRVKLRAVVGPRHHADALTKVTATNRLAVNLDF